VGLDPGLLGPKVAHSPVLVFVSTKWLKVFAFKSSSNSATRFDLKKRAVANRYSTIKELLDRGGGNPTRAAPSTLRSSETSPTLRRSDPAFDDWRRRVVLQRWGGKGWKR
jgi:hypothetical protein